MIHNCSKHVSGITDDKAVHAPFALHNVVDFMIEIARRTIDAVICGHHRACPPFTERCFKRFQIVLALIPRIDANRSAAAINFIIVAIEMLQGSNRLIIERMIPLHSLDKLRGQAPSQVWIFAISLFRSAPSRVAFHIDRWRPNRQTVNSRIALIIYPRFIRDDFTDFMHELRVPSTGQARILRKHSSFAKPSHAMCPLGAMLIFFYAKPGNFCLVLTHQLNFLFQRKSGH
ncbi:hypothetical protein D3C77_266840 [compost metagenome]